MYIRRARTGELRLLANEAQIEQILSSCGFRIIDPKSMDSTQIAEAALDARIVVSVEGSQLAHGMYCAADDAVFLVLQPPDRLSMVYKEFTDRMGMGFAFVVGEPQAEGFSVSPDDLQRALCRLSPWW
jgi:capsular polysaccharide biosynthesis protein